MRRARWLKVGAGLSLLLSAVLPIAQQDPLVIFAVVTKIPKDRKQVTAQVSTGGAATEATLSATEPILDNLIWKKREIGHRLKGEAWRAPGGSRLVSGKKWGPARCRR